MFLWRMRFRLILRHFQCLNNFKPSLFCNAFCSPSVFLGTLDNFIYPHKPLMASTSLILVTLLYLAIQTQQNTDSINSQSRQSLADSAVFEQTIWLQNQLFL